MTQCKAKSKRSGKRCKNPPMRGKDVCRMHGGKTPIKHGLYSRYNEGTIGARAAEMRADPEILDLRNQVAIAAALQERFLAEHLGEKSHLSLEEIDSLRKLTDTVSKLVVAHDRVTGKDENLVPIEVVGVLVDRFVEAVNRYVLDTDTRAHIVDALSSFTDLPAPSVH